MNGAGEPCFEWRGEERNTEKIFAKEEMKAQIRVEERRRETNLKMGCKFQNSVGVKLEIKNFIKHSK